MACTSRSSTAGAARWGAAARRRTWLCSRSLPAPSGAPSASRCRWAVGGWAGWLVSRRRVAGWQGACNFQQAATVVLSGRCAAQRSTSSVREGEEWMAASQAGWRLNPLPPASESTSGRARWWSSSLARRSWPSTPWTSTPRQSSRPHWRRQTTRRRWGCSGGGGGRVEWGLAVSGGRLQVLHAAGQGVPACFTCLLCWPCPALPPAPPPPVPCLQAWRDALAEMSRVSCEAYRSVVRGDQRFIDYFQRWAGAALLGDVGAVCPRVRVGVGCALGAHWVQGVDARAGWQVAC